MGVPCFYQFLQRPRKRTDPCQKAAPVIRRPGLRPFAARPIRHPAPRSGQRPQERGFAAAVTSDQRHPLAGVKLEIRMIKQGNMAIGKRSVGKNQQGHGGIDSGREPNFNPGGGICRENHMEEMIVPTLLRHGSKTVMWNWRSRFPFIPKTSSPVPPPLGETGGGVCKFYTKPWSAPGFCANHCREEIAGEGGGRFTEK